MDCYWSKEYVEEQKAALEYQIVLAHRKGLPVIIHSREATGPIFDVLDRCRHLDMRGVFHAFSGSIETFRRLQKYGDWYVGIGGSRRLGRAAAEQGLHLGQGKKPLPSVPRRTAGGRERRGVRAVEHGVELVERAGGLSVHGSSWCWGWAAAGVRLRRRARTGGTSH